MHGEEMVVKVLAKSASRMCISRNMLEMQLSHDDDDMMIWWYDDYDDDNNNDNKGLTDRVCALLYSLFLAFCDKERMLLKG